MDPSRRRFFSAGYSVPGKRPPWALGEDTFTSLCNRCDACVRACPQRVLSRGAGGFPTVDFSRAGCTLCGACVEACERGALARAGEPFPWRARITQRCVSLRGVECRICAENCEAGAIRIRLRPGEGARPELDPELCNGCGQCIAPCPVAAIDTHATEVAA